ncbi:GNAT family N-acetyltransferase [Gallaecimonas mangrovi]|uniref:GNAT family N-acetyltransferase n=1 Tax=Gallaecimonas mangrovi TaxID=2291597 RepID=UPI000E2013EB|nr:GNAT family N-acetyltransferase [Gallaecimonas mangrovi]
MTLPDTIAPFTFLDPKVGAFTLRPLKLPDDMALIHGWLSQQRARFWAMEKLSISELCDFYQQLKSSGKGGGFIGEHQGKAVMLIECYDPAQDPVGEHYAVAPGDLGMHILLAPAKTPIRGFSRAAFNATLHFCFDGVGASRVVVEPDTRNQAIHRLNRQAGFVYERQITLPDKIAELAFCTAEQFAKAQQPTPHRSLAVAAHLTPARWQQVNRHLVRKMLAELCHEKVFIPKALGDGVYSVAADDGQSLYRFTAKITALDHWLIAADSIECWQHQQCQPIDAASLVLACQQQLKIKPAMLGTYLEEIAATLYSAAYKAEHQQYSSAELVDVDFQTIERAMTEGHPCFIANNGRIGFDALDFPAYAPEAGQPVRLIWLAAHKDDSVFATSRDLDYRRLLLSELGEGQLNDFEASISQKGFNPAHYYLMPVHPWQWFNKLVYLFAKPLATGRLICLGEGLDCYQAQQSIRTFFNRDKPENCYVKTALSILNMGFMRGLSPYYMSTTPAINDFVYDLVNQDPYLAETGFSILREVAGVGYMHPDFETTLDKHSPYRKMLSGLWRESPLPSLNPGQKLMSMTALLHQDNDGKALLVALIRASGLDTRQWLRRYLKAYLSPLLHCFYAHDLVFMPHGENLILVMENQVPVRAIMKDIAEEIAILNTEVVLSEQVKRLAVAVPDDYKVLSILTDVFDCFFRFIGAILEEQADVSEGVFWALVAECVLQYQDAHPALAEKFKKHDLFAPQFTLSCLNRLQLANNQQMVDLADPAGSLQFAGVLNNPIAPFAREKEATAPKMAQA